MKAYIEKDIQRSLASNLHLLEPGIECEKVEYYLKAPPYGTKGFIDILAKDSIGNTMIIEIKSRRATTREAIHELLKYSEYIKREKGLNDEELRLCIVATDWSELMIPFSSAYAQMDINLEGYRLNVSETGQILSLEKVRPLKLSSERILSDCHLTLWCQGKKDVENALHIIRSHFDECGHTRYIAAVLEAPEGFAEEERELLRQQMENLGLDTAGLAQYCSPAYGVCIASQKYDKKECHEIIARSPYLSRRFEEDFGSDIDNTPEYYLHNTTFYSKIWDHASNGIYCELTEPHHFRMRVEDEGWKILHIVRGATFADTSMLSHTVLVDELKGVCASAADERLYKQQLNSQNRAGIQKACRKLKVVLAMNHFWRLPLIEQLEDMRNPEDGIFSGKLSVYEPMSILRYLYLYSIDTEPSTLLPKATLICAHINLDADSIKFVRYTCILEKVRKSLPFDSILNKYYSGKKAALRAASVFDGYRDDNSEIVYDLGFEYRVYRETTINPGPLNVQDGTIGYISILNEPTIFEQYDDSRERFVPCNPQIDYYQRSFDKFMNEEKMFMIKLRRALSGTEEKWVEIQ